MRGGWVSFNFFEIYRIVKSRQNTIFPVRILKNNYKRLLNYTGTAAKAALIAFSLPCKTWYNSWCAFTFSCSTSERDSWFASSSIFSEALESVRLVIARTFKILIQKSSHDRIKKSVHIPYIFRLVDGFFHPKWTRTLSVLWIWKINPYPSPYPYRSLQFHPSTSPYPYPYLGTGTGRVRNPSTHFGVWPVPVLRGMGWPQIKTVTSRLCGW